MSKAYYSWPTSMLECCLAEYLAAADGDMGREGSWLDDSSSHLVRAPRLICTLLHSNPLTFHNLRSIFSALDLEEIYFA